MNFLVVMVVSAAPWLQGVTAKDGVVPVQVVDSADFICNVHPRFHVELLDAATGAPKAEVSGWSQVLGELADGAIVVTNESVAQAKVLKVGVLERTGALRLSCEVPFAVTPHALTWMQSEQGLEGRARMVQGPSGVAQTPDPDQFVTHLFKLTLGGTWCELATSGKAFEGKQTPVPGPALMGKEFETRTNGNFIDTARLSGKKIAWVRHTSFVSLECHPP